MTYKEAKKVQQEYVYFVDKYDEVSKFELNWERNTVWLKNDIMDDFASIKDFFEAFDPLFETFPEAVEYIKLK